MKPGCQRFRENRLRIIIVSLVLATFSLSAESQDARWTEDRANTWYAQQPPLIGANFLPSNAINELEMWQAETFDAATIDRELGFAEGIGMNTMRVFLHNLLWEQDSKAFERRMDTFLSIAAKHHIHPIFVLLDSCWDPYPKLGPQHPPIPGVHNSGWVQAPGAEVLSDPAQYPRIERYIEGVVGAFAHDQRILAWDLWNEPDNGNEGSFGKKDPRTKGEIVQELLPKVFAWARSAHPSQPLTSGLYSSDWSSVATMSSVARIQFEQSDVITFHDYGWPEHFEQSIKQLQAAHRPIICTEYMARGNGSTFDTIVPVGHRYHVGLINWGFVAGKSQTYLPWDSWQRPYVLEKPPVWFHDVFHPDGTPYRERETEIIRDFASKGW
jgi:hypothetical protein